MDFKGAFIESLFVTIGFAVLGGILFWLIAGRYWGKAKAKPYQLGLWWGAWLVAASVMALGGKNYYKGFEEVFFRMILTIPIIFGIGFIAGFVFRKLKPIAGTLPTVANTPSNISGASDSHFAEAMAEIDESRMDKGLWARCFAESDGLHEKAKASYIRLRVAVLAASVMPIVNVSAIALNSIKSSAKVNFATPIIVLLVVLSVALVTGLAVKDKDSQVSTSPVVPVATPTPLELDLYGLDCERTRKYARWIIDNADKRGTPDFDTVARAYKSAKGWCSLGRE